MKRVARKAAHLALLCALLPAAAAAERVAARCEAKVAQWLAPGDGSALDAPALFERLAGGGVVLLGEEHTHPAHHRWQAYVLAALHSRQPDMVLGFEMLPRQAQPVLDEWSAGVLTEKQMLERVRWREVWGYDAALYMPLFHLARSHRLRAVALNVDRELIARVGADGWSAVPVDQREGVSDPAPASAEYRASLARVFAYKRAAAPDGAHDTDEVDLEEVLRSDAFSNFVDAQLTWDRAMAEALADARRRDPAALVVGIVGRGHLEYGHGIPHQLAALGVEDVSILLPLDSDRACETLPEDIADAVFVVEARRDDEPPVGRPRLGVLIDTGEGGTRITKVLHDSVAARSGLAVDDVIASAAGFPTPTPSALIEVVGRQAPGTWLPLTVLRGDERREIVAKFPETFTATP